MKNILYRICTPFSNEYKDTVNGVVLGLLAVAWVFIVATTIERVEEFDPIILLRVLSVIGITAGVYVAIWKLLHDHRWRQSEVYLEQAKELFEKSFITLKIDPKTDYPVNDRYVWLSSSRLLLAATELGKKIEDISHQETFSEYVEFWRMKFIDLLGFDGDKSLDKYYFFEKGALSGWSRNQRAPLAERSIYVIFRFMQWPDQRNDRLENQSNFSEEEIKRMKKFGPRGLAEYCLDKRKRS